MNWLVFAIVAYVLLVLQVGLRTLLGLPGPEGVAPSFTLILLVYVGLMAPPRTAMWAALVLGVLVDAVQGPMHGVQVLGPTALGYVAGAVVILQLRGIVFRESVLTMAVTTFFVGIFVQLTMIAMYTFRGLGFIPAEAVPGWSVADELVAGFQMLLYTSAWAFVVGFVLLRLEPLFSFPKPRSDRYY